MCVTQLLVYWARLARTAQRIAPLCAALALAVSGCLSVDYTLHVTRTPQDAIAQYQAASQAYDAERLMAMLSYYTAGTADCTNRRCYENALTGYSDRALRQGISENYPQRATAQEVAWFKSAIGLWLRTLPDGSPARIHNALVDYTSRLIFAISDASYRRDA